MSLEQAPTRAVLLALREEREVVHEAYNFLDEKRLLLAAEIVKQLKEYEALREQLEIETAKARQQLAAALSRHGLRGLTVYPTVPMKAAEIKTTARNFMGVHLQKLTLQVETTAADTSAICRPTAEAEACRALFQRLTESSATLAGFSSNLHRLVQEYRITQRRARALENVIIPELDDQLSETSVYLEEMDMEDIIRARSSQ